jgi:hypothetical protein
MELITDEASAGRGGGTAWSQNKQKCKIFTVGWEGKKGEEGYNLGRKYCISMDMTNAQLREAKVGGGMGSIEKLVVNGKFVCLSHFVKTLKELVRQAKHRQESTTIGAYFWRSRLVVRGLFLWTPFQFAVGVLLVTNFVMSGLEAQMGSDLTLDDGSPSRIAVVLEFSDKFFLIIFTVELALNLYAHWMRDFISDSWSCFDFFVVMMSLLKPLLENLPVPVTVFRLFRAFRILRLFGRLHSLKKIINALSASFVPVLNAFVIMGIVLLLYAIIGVSFFEERAPDSFGKLDRAVASLFRIAGGDTWIDNMDVLDKESGLVDWGMGAFVFSFILVVNWTLLQVSVAVLPSPTSVCGRKMLVYAALRY